MLYLTKKMLSKLLLTIIVMLPISVLAASPQVPSDVSKNITAAFKSVRPDWKLQSIGLSQIQGLYQVQVVNGPLVYSSASGEYFIAGDIFQITPKGFVNLAEQNREGDRVKLLATVQTKEMIIYSPKSKAKDFVTVFTDVDCGFCRKLHNEVPKLNELGIEVRYLAYPRAGIGSQSYKKIVTAWCDEDPNKALTALKAGKVMSLNLCENNPVAKQFTLGQQIGVTGTPAIITSTGQLLPGYMPAEKLAEVLDL